MFKFKKFETSAIVQSNMSGDPSIEKGSKTKVNILSKSPVHLVNNDRLHSLYILHYNHLQIIFN